MLLGSHRWSLSAASSGSLCVTAPGLASASLLSPHHPIHSSRIKIHPAIQSATFTTLTLAFKALVDMSPCPPRVRAPTEWAAPPSSSRTKIFAELDIAERQSLAFHLVNRQNVAPNKLWNSGDMGAWTLAVAPGDHAFQHPPDSDSALTVRVTRRAWPGSLLHFCKHASEASFRKGVSYMSIGRCSHGDMSAVPLDLHNQQTATKHGDLLHRPPG